MGPVLAASRRRYLPQHLQLAGQAGLAAGGGRFPGMAVEDVGADPFFRGEPLHRAGGALRCRCVGMGGRGRGCACVCVFSVVWWRRPRRCR
jgi:hypothetical protein